MSHMSLSDRVFPLVVQVIVNMFMSCKLLLALVLQFIAEELLWIHYKPRELTLRALYMQLSLFLLSEEGAMTFN